MLGDLRTVETDVVAAHMAAYLERRAGLVRFFTLRTGSATAAEDVVQEIYFKLRAMTPEAAAEVRSIGPFLYRLGSNLWLDRLKSERSRGARDDAWRRGQAVEFGGVDAAALPAADDAAYARLKLEQVVLALGKLPPKCRRAFELHKLEGLSHSETAAVLGVSRSAVEKYVSAAVKHLLKEVGWP